MQSTFATAENHSCAHEYRLVTAVRLGPRAASRLGRGKGPSKGETMAVTVDAQALADFSSSISGSVLGPGDEGYEDSRRVHNGLIDRRPAVIVQCQNAEDAA